MKTKLMMVATILLVNVGVMVQAQGNGLQKEKREFNVAKMDSMQCRKMVNDLMLDDATTAKFETMYMNYLSEMRNYRMPINKMIKGDIKKEQPKEMNDAEVQNMLETRFKNEQKMLDLRVKYYKEFQRILSPKQILRILYPHFTNEDMRPPRFNNKNDKKMPYMNGQPNEKWNEKEENEFPKRPIDNEN